MSSKITNAKKKTKTPISSIILYIFSAISAIITIESLVNNFSQYNKAVTYYVSQGSTRAQVTSQLISSQLLPAIYQSIITYGGIALILVAAGIINHKVSKCLALLSNDETDEENIEETILDSTIVDDATVKQDEVIE